MFSVKHVNTLSVIDRQCMAKLDSLIEKHLHELYRLHLPPLPWHTKIMNFDFNLYDNTLTQ
jgi:hypothetical protein